MTTKTEALRQARIAVGQIHRRSSTDYVFYAPYYSSRPDGPSTESQHDSYPKARLARTESVADVALALYYADRDDAPDRSELDMEFMLAVERHGIHEARAIVSHVIAQFERDPEATK